MTGIPPEAYGGATSASAETTSPVNPAGWFREWAGLSGTPGGPNVNENTALNLPVLYACVTLIATTTAALPLNVYRRSGKDRSVAEGRSEHRVLHSAYNADMTAMVGRETGFGHLLTWGNSFAQIVRNKSGSTLLEIRPVGPDVVRVVRDARTRQLGYEVRQRGTADRLVTLTADEVLHVPGFGGDGILGYSPVRLARSAIRSAMAMNAAAEQFAVNGFRPPGAVKFRENRRFKTPQEGAQWRKDFQQIHMTEGGAMNVVVLEDGSDWVSLGTDPESAQLLESRKFERGEISTIYRCPPHMVGDSDKQTSWGTGVDEMTRGFVAYTLTAWAERAEQEYDRKLFPGSAEYYTAHDFKGLLRGDILERSQALEVQRRNGVTTTNEWRAEEDLNPVAGGDDRIYPMNMVRLGADGEVLSAGAAADAHTPHGVAVG